MIRSLLSFLIISATYVLGIPQIQCPSYLYKNGFINDLTKLIEVSTWDNNYVYTGLCGVSIRLLQVDGDYNTRMTVYNHIDKDVVIFAFPSLKPTDFVNFESDELVPCTFINGSCSGLVHKGLQDIFLHFSSYIDQYFINGYAIGRRVYLGGYELGGALQLMMSLFLWKLYDIIPQSSLGLSAPFFGDEEFTKTYQEPFKTLMGFEWWQVEPVLKSDNSTYDNSTETPHNQNIYIQQDVICGLEVDSDNHNTLSDFKNYKNTLIGQSCISF